MLDGFDRSALAESDDVIAVLSANNVAAEQIVTKPKSSPAQLLFDAASYNSENPDNKIHLTPEQGQSIITSFVDFVAGSPETPTADDGRTLTFNELDDNQLVKCLSDYLGSGIVNTSVNGAMIEGAQELIAEMYMSEEELADLPNPKTANGQAAKQKILLDKMRDAAEDERKQLQENRDKWDSETHDYGGEQLTGAEIMERINWFSKKANQEKVRQELLKKGKTEKEADEIIAKMKERDELLKRERDGNKANPPLTAADKTRLAMLNNDDDVKLGGAIAADISKQDKIMASKLAANETSPVKAVDNADADLAALKKDASSTFKDSGSNYVVNEKTTIEAMPSKVSETSTGRDGGASASSKEAYAHFNTAPVVKDAFIVAANDPVYETASPMPATKPAAAVATAKLNNDMAALM